eukprot:snap_masked-scaffold_10-processed-gene-12.42-mRNA-1 protein AED:1.00 eAED:1.00 QI:0/0/0/0/1/1/3/0/61
MNYFFSFTGFRVKSAVINNRYIFLGLEDKEYISLFALKIMKFLMQLILLVMSILKRTLSYR